MAHKMTKNEYLVTRNNGYDVEVFENGQRIRGYANLNLRQAVEYQIAQQTLGRHCLIAPHGVIESGFHLNNGKSIEKYLERLAEVGVEYEGKKYGSRWPGFKTRKQELKEELARERAEAE